MTKQGLAIHGHHDILMQYCYDYDERVNAIKQYKPLNEQEIRLRLFKILPEEAIKEIPERFQKADAEWRQTNAKWWKALAEWQWQRESAEREKAYAVWQKAGVEWEKAYAVWQKAETEWSQKEKEIFHAKWCGCKEWNGKEIVFDKQCIK